MPKSGSDYIREELQKDFDQNAAELATRLSARGVRINSQHVYQVRSAMRRERENRTRNAVATRQENGTTLAEHILLVLHKAPDGLTDRQVSEAVAAAGYVSRAASFFESVRNKLYELVEKGSVVKTAQQYGLSDFEKDSRKSPVQATITPPVAVVAVTPPPVVVVEEPPPVPLIAKQIGDSHNYLLLRQAVIDFARFRGFRNPETFPDTLISQRREFLDAESQYKAVIESGEITNGKAQE